MGDTNKVLLRAAELVEQGWCQHVGAQRAGHSVPWNAADVDQVCLTTAVARAVGEITGEPIGESVNEAGLVAFVQHPLLVASAERLYACYPEWTDGMAPIRWNNTPGRTADEVAALLRRAAQEGS